MFVIMIKKFYSYKKLLLTLFKAVERNIQPEYDLWMREKNSNYLLICNPCHRYNLETLVY